MFTHIHIVQVAPGCVFTKHVDRSIAVMIYVYTIYVCEYVHI